jgi:hypothetical protein
LTARTVTEVPLGNTAEQSAPQSIPAGEVTIVPVPVPAFVTVSVCPGGGVASAVPSVATAASAAIVPMIVLPTFTRLI